MWDRRVFENRYTSAFASDQRMTSFAAAHFSRNPASQTQALHIDRPMAILDKPHRDVGAGSVMPCNRTSQRHFPL
jgi:hypothetical protein